MKSKRLKVSRVAIVTAAAIVVACGGEQALLVSPHVDGAPPLGVVDDPAGRRTPGEPPCRARARRQLELRCRRERHQRAASVDRPDDYRAGGRGRWSNAHHRDRAARSCTRISLRAPWPAVRASDPAHAVVHGLRLGGTSRTCRHLRRLFRRRSARHRCGDRERARLRDPAGADRHRARTSAFSPSATSPATPSRRRPISSSTASPGLADAADERPATRGPRPPCDRGRHAARRSASRRARRASESSLAGATRARCTCLRSERKPTKHR